MQDLSNNPDFQRLSEQKQQMVLLLVQSLQGNSMADALGTITAWNRQLKQENINFTPEENRLLFSVLSAGLSPEQRQQFERLRSMLPR